MTAPVAGTVSPSDGQTPPAVAAFPQASHALAGQPPFTAADLAELDRLFALQHAWTPAESDAFDSVWQRFCADNERLLAELIDQITIPAPGCGGVA